MAKAPPQERRKPEGEETDAGLRSATLRPFESLRVVSSEVEGRQAQGARA
jgi:hypothetical protein